MFRLCAIGALWIALASAASSISPLSGLTFSWSLDVDSSQSTVLSGTFNYTGDVWVGVGLKSDTKMHGPLVVCYINRTSSTGACRDYRNPPGRDTGVALQEKIITQTLAFTSSGTENSISFSTIVKLANQSDAEALIELSGAYRSLWARGTWTPGRDLPNKHAGTDRIPILVDFSTGFTTETSPAHMSRLVIVTLIAVGAMIILLLCAGRVAHAYHVQVSARLVFIIRVAVLLLVIGGLVVYLFGMKDYQEKIGAFAPFYRSLGRVNAVLFGLLLIPVNQQLEDFLVIARPSALKVHYILVYLCVVCVAVHGVGMFFDSDACCSSKGVFGIQLRFIGTASFVALLAVSIPASLRLLNWIPFPVFRVSHFFFPVALVLVVLHYSGAWILMLPGLVLYVAGFVYRFVIRNDASDGAIKVFHYNEMARVVTLEVLQPDQQCCSGLPSTGSWFAVSFPALSIVSHPFSVSRATALSEGGYAARFRIKVTENLKGWTQKVSALAKAAPADVHCRIQGPYGAFTTNPSAYFHFLMISGGIGITPNIYLLQELAARAPELRGGSIFFLWVARSREIIEMFSTELMEYEAKLSPHLALVIKIFLTVPTSPDVPLLSAPVGSPKNLALDRFIATPVGHRPDWKAELVAHSALVASVKAQQGTSSQVQVVLEGISKASACATYMCGPQNLTNNVEQEISRHQSPGFTYHIHVEEFSL